MRIMWNRARPNVQPDAAWTSSAQLSGPVIVLAMQEGPKHLPDPGQESTRTLSYLCDSSFTLFRQEPQHDQTKVHAFIYLDRLFISMGPVLIKGGIH